MKGKGKKKILKGKKKKQIKTKILYNIKLEGISPLSLSIIGSVMKAHPVSAWQLKRRLVLLYCLAEMLVEEEEEGVLLLAEKKRGRGVARRCSRTARSPLPWLARARSGQKRSSSGRGRRECAASQLCARQG